MSDTPLSPGDPLAAALARTPARLLAGRAGPGYRTATWLKLREDHAAARDAVHGEIDLARLLSDGRIAEFRFFLVKTKAGSKPEYLLRPDLGRRLDDESRADIVSRCPANADLQVVVGDGLSTAAVSRQVPPLIDRIGSEAKRRGWQLGRPFAVRFCRVGVMNDVGELLSPEVVVLLIGERPGLATAESLSAYLAYRPHAGQTDADRNLISNIHGRGVSPEDAAARICGLADRFRRERRSGFTLKEAVRPPGADLGTPPAGTRELAPI
jgi:ethanolamine ammonia-lyase small subunit